MRVNLYNCLIAFLMASKLLAVPLAGTYTVGGTMPNFTTISAAITALDSNGISAPVVFNIRNGTYPELLFFNAVTGTSATNTITFQGESGDSSLVVINGATTSNQQNSVRFQQIDFLTLKHLTIRQMPNVNNNAILFIYRGKYCTISNCELFGHSSSTSSATEYAVQGNNDTGFVIKNSYVHGASTGIYLGAAFFSHRYSVVENCVIATGGNNIFIDGGALATIRGNDVGGRVLLQQTSRCTIHDNFFHGMLQSISSSGWPQQKMKIYNNVILGGSYQGAVAYGFWAGSSSNYDFYNNTIYMNTPTMSGYAFNTDVYPGGITVKNNIFYRADTNAANYIFRYPNAESSAGYIQSDHNLFYRNGTSFSNNYTSLAAFTAGTGLDSNSVYADPLFLSPSFAQLTSYLATAPIANSIGEPVSYIPKDILGNNRHPNHPTVGALENPNNVYCVVNAVDFITACNQHQWIDGNVYTSSNNTATFTFVAGAANGCDSVVTLNLTIIPTTSSTHTVNACNSYTWMDGNTYTSSTNLPTFTITSMAGCDSIITLNLTITMVDTAVTVGNASLLANASNATYQWLQCNGNYTAISGETNQIFHPALFAAFYAVEIMQNGCVDTSACYSLIVTENQPIFDKLETFTLYPNPANDVLNIQINSTLKNQNSDFCIIIQNVLGETVYANKNCNTHEILDVSDYTKGLYFVKLNSQISKFAKQ